MKIIRMISFCLPFVFAHANAANSKNIKDCLEAYQHSKFKEAFAICLPLAEKKDPLAQFLVGNMLNDGLGGVGHNPTAAMQWLKKSADGGNASAQLKLAKLYCKGSPNVRIDHAKATKYLHKAAASQVSEAQFLLAMCYFKGIGVKQNLATSQYWFNQAVSSGLNNAQGIASPIVLRDHATEKAPGIEAYEIANQILKEEDDLYLESDLVWRQLAAEQGHPQAQYDICLHYLKNAKSDADLKPAINWLQKAAENEHQGAQTHLAWLQAIGIDMPENLTQAVIWFQKACNPVNPKESAEPVFAQVRYDFDHAMQLLEHSVDDQDIHYALDTIDKCAQQNLPEAQFYLGKLYQQGKMVTLDKSLAAHLFEKAAHKGHLEAQFNLGWMFLKGDGVPREYMQAYYWLSKANESREQSQTSNIWGRLNHLSRLPYS